MRKISVVIAAAACMLISQSAFAETAYWVSPQGSDLGSGTESSPFATVDKAREVIRKNKPSPMTEDIVVYIQKGTYYHENPITFTEEDSGTDGYNIIYKNAPDSLPEEVCLVGGTPAEEWIDNGNGIYYADVGENNVWTIYEDGVRGISARYPNLVVDEEFPMARAPYLYARSDGGRNSHSLLTYNDGEISKSAQNAIAKDSWSRLFIWSASGYDWYTDTIEVNAINKNTNTIYFTGETKYSPSSDDNRKVTDANGVKAGSRYFLMNTLAFLDQPGEFYMNPYKDRIYYKPRNAENLTNEKIIIPKVKTLLLVEGSSEETPVHNIRFEGITVQDTDFRDTSINSGKSTDGVLATTVGGAGNISLKNAENITVSGCIIKNSGLNGINLDDYCKHNTVENCLITNVGSNGINLHGKSLGTGDVNTQNVITNCRIDRAGELDSGGNGIVLRQSSSNTISHCYVTNTVRTGISLFGLSDISDFSGVYTSGNNISYMLFEDCMQDSGDDGVIYLNRTGNETYPHTNTFEQILIDGAKAHPQMLDMKPDGVYTDINSYGQKFKNVEVRNVARYSFVAYKFSGTSKYVTGHTFENVSWNGYNYTGELLSGSTIVGGKFDSSKMDYENIGLTDNFPFADYDI